MKIIRLFILNLLSFFYSKLIILSLIYNEIILKKKIFYSNSLGFGDNIMFYLNNYTQIKKNNYFVFEFCKKIDGPINFFFPRSKIIYPLISIPFFIYYRCVQKLKKSKFFSPSIDERNWTILLSSKNKDSFRRLIKIKLKNYKPSNKVESFLQKERKYFCIHIKLSLSQEDLSGSNSRATANKNKIFKIINYLIKSNFHIVFLGLKYDPIVSVIKEYIRMSNLENYVDLLIDLSPTYNFTDQLFVAADSEGYIGSGSGPLDIYFYLKKKALVFDYSFFEHYNLPHFLSYRRILFKKISINNSEYELLDEKLIKSITKCNTKNNYRIMENSYEDIIKNIQTFFYIK